jgi:hypothetical protein
VEVQGRAGLRLQGGIHRIIDIRRSGNYTNEMSYFTAILENSFSVSPDAASRCATALATVLTYEIDYVQHSHDRNIFDYLDLFKSNFSHQEAFEEGSGYYT